MSPRAGCRLEGLGFTDVYDYAAGKVDWLAHNLPTDGTVADTPTAGSRLRTDVVTAALHERIADIRARVQSSRYRFALVVAANRTLLGRLRGAALNGDPDLTAEQAMESGPSTIRPHTPLDEIGTLLRDRNLTTSLVTDPEGRLLGLLHRDDLNF